MASYPCRNPNIPLRKLSSSAQNAAKPARSTRCRSSFASQPSSNGCVSCCRWMLRIPANRRRHQRPAAASQGRSFAQCRRPNLFTRALRFQRPCGRFHGLRRRLVRGKNSVIREICNAQRRRYQSPSRMALRRQKDPRHPTPPAAASSATRSSTCRAMGPICQIISIQPPAGGTCPVRGSLPEVGLIDAMPQ